VVAVAAAVALEGAQQQVVLDAHLAEQLALLGHQVHARATMRSTSGTCSMLPSKATCP
jgi:hypothetical protein